MTREDTDRGIDDYVDIEAQEREKFLQIDGVGEKTAEKLLRRYDLFDHAVGMLLGAPNAYAPEIGPDRTDQLRDALQDAGYEPPCGCSHYEDVRYSQSRDDVTAHCRGCGEVLSR